jgi:hypothetical protein
MLHRFCIMLAAVGSSQVQVTFMPPVHFSNFIVHRGTIIMFGIIGAPLAGIIPVPMPIPGMPIPVRSIMIVLVIAGTPLPKDLDPSPHLAKRPLAEETSARDRRAVYEVSQTGKA